MVAQLLKVYKMEELEKQGLKNAGNVYILKLKELDFAASCSDMGDWYDIIKGE